MNKQDSSISYYLAGKRIDERKQTLNYLFGFIPWRGHLGFRPINKRSKNIQELYGHVDDNILDERKFARLSFWQVAVEQIGNYGYLIFFGWWIAALHFIVAMFCFLSLVFIPHGTMLLQMAKYYLWPFNKIVAVDCKIHVCFFLRKSVRFVF